jgi:hypothetical protein
VIEKKGRSGAPGEIRTPDLLLRRQSLYPAELRARTHMTSLHAEVRGINLLPIRQGQRRLPALHTKDTFKSEPLPAPASAPTPAFATAAAISAVSPSATRALNLGTSFVDVQCPSTDLRSIQRGDCLFPVLVAGHLDEPKAARTSCIPVSHDAHAVHLPISFKHLSQFVFVGVEAQVSYENILHASASALSCRKCELNSADLAGREGLPENRNRSWRTVECGQQYSRFTQCACQAGIAGTGTNTELARYRIAVNLEQERKPFFCTTSAE